MKRKPSRSKSPSGSKKHKKKSSSSVYWSENEHSKYKLSPLSPIENFYASHSESPDLEHVPIPWIQKKHELLEWDESHIRKAFDYLLNHKYKKYKFIEKIFGNEENVDIFQINSNGTIEDNLYGNYSKIREYILNRPKIKLIVAPFCIDFGDDAHANLLIINKVNLTVELYEPHGSSTHFIDWAEYEIGKRVKTHLTSLYPNIFDSYIFLSYTDTCPLKSFQYIEDTFIEKNEKIDKEGYCIHWSLFMLDLRLKYYKYQPKQIQEMMIRQTKELSGKKNKVLAEKFLNFIRKYTYYIDKYKNISISNISNRSKSTSPIYSIPPTSLFDLEIEGNI